MPNVGSAGECHAAAAPAQRTQLGVAALGHRTIPLEALADSYEAKIVQAAEHGHVRGRKGSVAHVEVFRMGSVRTSIIGTPRPSPSDRRAYTSSSGKSPAKPMRLTVSRAHTTHALIERGADSHSARCRLRHKTFVGEEAPGHAILDQLCRRDCAEKMPITQPDRVRRQREHQCPRRDDFGY
jgi:hypothetical protein